MPERMTAKMVSLSEIASGEWVHQDGMEPSYVVLKNKEKVSRVRVMATVVSKFSSDDGNFGSLTIDDGTDTLRAKSFKDLSLIEKVEPGALVEVIGKIREYNGEIYIMPEIMKAVNDPNKFILRKLELIKRKQSLPKENETESRSGPENPMEQKAGFRKNIISIIEAEKDGIEYALLIEKSGKSEEEVEPIVNDILSEGICYEPTPGKIKKI